MQQNRQNRQELDGGGNCQAEGGGVSIGMLLWAVLLLALLGLGGYWLSRDAGVGVAGLGETEGGAQGTKDSRANSRQGIPGKGDTSQSDVNAVPGLGNRESTRTVVASHGLGNVPVLEVRIFLGREPLTKGIVFFSHANTDPNNLMPFTQGIVLDGTNEAKVALPMLHQKGMWGKEVTIAASFTRKIPGITNERWVFQKAIPGPVKGQRWIGPDMIMKCDHLHVLCKGHVVNEVGQPIPDSKVWLEQPSSQQSAPRIVFTTAGVRSDNLSLASASNGFFEIRHDGKAKGKILHLDVGAPGYLCARHVPFQPGATDLRIVLRRAGSLRGSLVLPSAADPNVLRIGLFEEEDWEKKKSRARRVARCRPSGTNDNCAFSLETLPAGRYLLSIGYVDEGHSLMLVHGIEIHAGQESRDARVQKLDLTGVLKAIRVQVTAERRRGPLLATLSVKVSNANPLCSHRSQRVDEFGWAKLTIPSSGVDLAIQAPGYKKVQLRRVRTHVTVRLKKLDVLPIAEVQIRGGLPKKLPAGIWLELVPSAARGKAIRAKSFSLSGRYYFTKVPPGPYRVRIYLKRGSADSPRLAFDRDPLFQVKTSDEKQIFEVNIDRDRLVRFLKNCKKSERSKRRGR